MGFLLKELLLLTIVASALTLPWRSYDTAYDLHKGTIKDGAIVRDDTDETVDEPPPDGGEEIYPVATNTNMKRGLDLPVNDDEPPVHDEVETYPGATNTERGLLPFDENRKIRNKRGALTNPKYLWSVTTEGNGKRAVIIPYRYADDASSKVKKWMKDFTRQLDQFTCIRLRETNSNSHVNIVTKNSDGCFSDIGYRDSVQKVNLGAGCEFMATVEHEFMHLLGFFHEFTQMDRDNYIKVYKDNIQDGIYDTEFKKRTQNNLGFPYDKQSDMQYAKDTFSKSGANTMESKSNSNEQLGQTSHLDAMDLEKINKLYGCDQKDFVDHKITLKTGDVLGAGTDADMYVKLKGDKGETDWQLLSAGGAIADEKERAAVETYSLPFPDVGKIIAVYVSLESEGEVPSKKKRSIETAREMKRFWNTDGYTLGNLEVDGKSFGGNFDMYPGDKKKLSR